MASTIDIPTVETDASRGEAIVLRLPSKNDIYSNEEFWELCKLNPELRLEKNCDGSVVVMTPVVTDGGRQELGVAAQLWYWTKQNGQGTAFGPSAGFTLSNGSVRSPDASWIENKRWNEQKNAGQRTFATIDPDFVVEVKSPSDSLRELKEKMQEYMRVGVRLGWLINPETRVVEIYRPGKGIERLENVATVCGDPELPGFVLDLKEVW